VQATGNSNAIRGHGQPLRQAGGSPRTMLVSAAAKALERRSDVLPPAKPVKCFTPPDRETHQIWRACRRCGPVACPEDVALKHRRISRSIGTPAKRLDAPAKVNGTAVYGIDVRPPGVRSATLAQSPVFGVV